MTATRVRTFARLLILLTVSVILSAVSAHAQYNYALNYQTNTINVASNWFGNGTYVVGSNTFLNALNINSGGALTNGTGYLGFAAGGSNNSVQVTGTGVWFNAIDLAVGYDGSGNRLVITNAGKVFNGYGYVGRNSPSNNTVLVAGGGSVWSNRNDLTLGGTGNSLTITNGGVVFNSFGVVGGSNDSVLVSGTGSVWRSQSSLTVGSTLAGNSLTIADGGAVSSQGATVGGVAGPNSSNNIVTVTGGGSVWSNQTDFTIGNDGRGNRLTITNGGAVVSDTGYVGRNSSSSNNVVTVVGNGAQWNSGGFSLYVGYSGDTNTLNVGAGGTVSSYNAAYVGYNVGSDGNKLNVTGGSLYVTNGAGTGQLDVRRGTLTVNSGSLTVDTLSLTAPSTSVMVFNGGTVSSKSTGVFNGQLFVVGDGTSAATIHLLGGTHFFTSGLAISSNATLTGAGSIQTAPGALALLGGSIHAPGDGPGFQSINGNYSLANGATLQVDINGTIGGALYDQLGVNGSVTLGGALAVTPGFTPAPGNTFTIIANDGGDAVINTFAGLPNHSQFAVGPAIFRIDYDGGDGNDVVLTAVNAAILSVTPPSGLAPSGLAGGPFAPATQVYALTNSGNLFLGWTATKSASWLDLSAPGGGLPPGAGTNVTVSLNATATNLAAGVYTDTVWFTNVTSGVGNTSRSVTLTVTANPALQVTPAAGFSPAGLVGGPFTPATVVYALSNGGNLNLDWTAGKSASWVSVSATTGTLLPGASTNITVSLNSAATNLAVGAYADTVWFTNVTNGAGTTSRGVALTVNANPTLTVSPATGLTFTSPAGGPFNPATFSYLLNNIGTTNLGWSASANQSWISLPTSSGTLPGNSGVSVAVGLTAAANGLVASNYTGTITFTNTTNGAGTTTRPVSLYVYTAAANSWIYSGSSNWQDSARWSLAVPPAATQAAVLITNANTKTVTIDSVTTNTPATMTVLNLTLSAPSNSVNTLLVRDTGTNTPLRVVNSLLVNDGAVAVISNGSVSAGTAWIEGPGATAKVVVTGPNAMLRTDPASGVNPGFPSLGVGRTGPGSQLVVTNGGQVASGLSVIGASFGPILSNQVTVTGTGSRWQISVDPSLPPVAPPLLIGSGGNADQLLIGDGGRVDCAGACYIGLGYGTPFGRSNAVVVTGSGSQFNLSTDAIPYWGSLLVLGYGGSDNRLTIADGGCVSNVVAYVGWGGGAAPASNNLALVTGPGAVWSNAWGVVVGLYGSQNKLVITNEGHVISSLGVVGVGSNNNSAVVTGSNSLWNTFVLNIGDTTSASNQLTVANNGTVLSPSVVIGATTTNNVFGNIITVAGGNLICTNSSPGATLDVQNGALALNSGLVIADRFTATNGAGSAVIFNSGTFDTKGTTVSNTFPLVVGDTTNPAILVLEAGTHSFANGLIISNNGTLTGPGTIQGPVSLASGAIHAPGSSPGAQTVTGNYSLTNGATLQIEINGATAGSGYDQVAVTGVVTLGGKLALTLGYAPAPGTGFTVIDNQGGGAVAGTFAGLPNHAVFTVGGTVFQIAYDGGDGNDVVVTAVAAPLADFSGSPTNGLAALTVIFTDTSTGLITNRFWNFGNGTTNTTATVLTNIYAAGTYSVTLIVSGPGGASTITRPNYIVAFTPFEQWQLDHFGCSACPQAAAGADPDGDGLTNQQEYLAGTDPLDPLSALRITAIEPSGSGFVVYFSSVAGRTYRLVWDTSLSGSFTNVLADSIAGTGSSVPIPDPGAAPELKRFYRVKLVP